LKHKVSREAHAVALHRLYQGARLNAIELSQIRVNHHLRTANEINASLDELDGNRNRGIWKLLMLMMVTISTSLVQDRVHGKEGEKT
jgi:hypothetical protein